MGQDKQDVGYAMSTLILAHDSLVSNLVIGVSTTKYKSHD